MGGTLFAVLFLLFRLNYDDPQTIYAVAYVLVVVCFPEIAACAA